MDCQPVIKKVEAQMELSDSVLAMGEELIPGIMDGLEKDGVTFGENRMIGFISHLFNLIVRLEKGEHLPELDPAVLEQLEPDAMAISNRAMRSVEERYGTEPDPAETALTAIHVQTAMALKHKN